MVPIGNDEVGVGFGGGLPFFFGGHFPVAVSFSLAGGHEGTKANVWQEVEPFGVGLKIPAQCIVRRVVGGVGVKLIEGKVLVLGEGLRRDDVGGFKDAGVAFLFGIDPVAAYGFISVKGYRIEPLIQ